MCEEAEKIINEVLHKEYKLQCHSKDPKYIILSIKAFMLLKRDREVCERYLYLGYRPADGVTRVHGIPVSILEDDNNEIIIDVV